MVVGFEVYLILFITLKLNNCQVDDHNAEIVYYENQPNVNGNGYFWRYKTSNNIEHSETGTFQEKNGIPVLSVDGEYRYEAPDKKNYFVKYIADENGFQPIVRIWPIQEKEEKEDSEDDGVAVFRQTIDLKIGTTALETLIGGNSGK